jgi:hypothetical protein
MKSWKVVSLYLALSIAVLLPLLVPGYIQSFDLSWVPHPALPTSVDNLYLYSITVHYLALVIPSQLVEKALLLAILLTASISAHLLAQYILKSKNPWPPFFAGILYTINPFTYDRFMDGQYLVLVGYSLMPLFTLFLWKFLDRPRMRTLIPTITVALLVSITSIHTVFFLTLIALASSVAATIRRRRDCDYLINFSKWAFLGLFISLLASTYWLLPFFQGKSITAQEINTFDERQLLTFQTVPDHTYGLPAFLNPLTLYGYWGEEQGRFVLPKDKMPVWGMIFIFIFALAALGVLGYHKKERSRIVIFACLLILGWVFSVGIASPPFSYINLWLYDHLTFFRGYRDPQKFIALIALGYAVLGALGLDYLLAKTESWKDEIFKTMRAIFISLTLFLPLLYTTTMLFGFAGQLHSADYPADWYKTNDQLNTDKGNFQVLFLPWHHYMYFSFAGRIIGNPAPSFFDQPIISSTSDELGLIPSNAENSQTFYVESKVLVDPQNLGAKLNTLHIKYVLLAKETDWRNYTWLDKSPDLKLITNSPTVKLYLNIRY